MRWRPRKKRLLFLTGATGFLGTHVVAASETAEWELLAPASRALDVRERTRVLDDITSWSPNAIVHLAYRRDDRRAIVDGSRNIAEAAAAAGARLVHVSTDMVFAGREAPYSEDDTPDAQMNYGRWKAEAEVAVLAACPGAVVVRPSLLYGTDRMAPCQRDVDDVLAGRSRMSFFTDEYRNATHAADVAAALVALADRPEVSGPLHVAAPTAISRADLAAAFARRLGSPGAQVPTSTLAESGLDRPGRVVLSVARAEVLSLTCRDVHAAL